MQKNRKWRTKEWEMEDKRIGFKGLSLKTYSSFDIFKYDYLILSAAFTSFSSAIIPCRAIK